MLSSFALAFLAAGNFAVAFPASQSNDTFDPFIVGGSPATRGEFPWIVSIRKGRTDPYCGGTIINANWILTAAHCTVGQSASSFEVIAGEHIKSQREGSEQVVKVSKIVTHSSYNSNTMRNDIAMMKLKTPLTMNQYVKAAQLGTASCTIENSLVVAGWGTTRFQGRTSDTLLKVTVPLQPDEKCEGVYGGYSGQSQICAGEGGKDSCQGDSGGPLMNANSKTVVGVVSYGAGCGEDQYPGVYTKVGAFTSWINNNMK